MHNFDLNAPVTPAREFPNIEQLDPRNNADVTGRSTTIGPGVYGFGESSPGVWGRTESGDAGVFGEARTTVGVCGESTSGIGLVGKSQTGVGLHVTTDSPVNSAIVAKNTLNGAAGDFTGNVNVSNTLTVGVDIVLTNADCAEDFDIAGLEKVEPGTVMVIDQEGSLRQSDRAYDKRVAGVISGAGDFKPGIVLDKQESSRNRMPIALLGKVYCKVDANYGAIEVGDLLTTSPTPGHAMKTDDPLKAFGAVIGKALRPLDVGQGLIPILIALQ